MASSAAPGPTQRGSPWNPLRCAGTALPPQVLSAAKLIAVFLLAYYVARYDSFYGVRLDALSLELALLVEALRPAAKAVAVVSALLLLFNRGTRWAVLALGLTVTFEFALHRADYNELYLGGFLLLAALPHNRDEPLLPRYWVVLAHLASGMAWLFGEGSAPLFEALAGRETSANVFASKGFLAIEAALPPGLLPLLTDWGMSLASFGVAAGFLVRRFFPQALWAAIVVHCAWALLPGAFGALSYAILAPYLVFVGWPREPLVVIYDGECGFCNMTRQWISKVDFDGIYDWRPFQSAVGANYGISHEALEAKAHVVVGDRVCSGFRAFRVMALYNPAVSLAAAVLLATVGLGAPAMCDALFVALVLLFSPLVYPLGEAVYEWVARNRYRLPPRTCKAPE
jgi:predicted DCC family thiol-disulfide oxidoreductase YuxK